MDTMGFGLCLHLKRKIIRNGVMLSKSTDSEKKKRLYFKIFFTNNDFERSLILTPEIGEVNYWHLTSLVRKHKNTFL